MWCSRVVETLSRWSWVHCWIVSGVPRSELQKMGFPDPVPSFLVQTLPSCSCCWLTPPATRLVNSKWPTKLSGVTLLLSKTSPTLHAFKQTWSKTNRRNVANSRAIYEALSSTDSELSPSLTHNHALYHPPNHNRSAQTFACNVTTSLNRPRWMVSTPRLHGAQCPDDCKLAPDLRVRCC